MARGLEIVETQDAGTRVLSLVGRVDTNTSSQLEAAARRIYAEDRAANIVLDLAECGYVSSAGLRVIVSMQKRSTVAGSLRFRNVSADVMEVFRSTGFDRILVFE